MRSVVDVDTLFGYGATIVGSASYNGAWLPEAVHFARSHAAALSQTPIAYFVVCATMRQDTPEHRQGAALIGDVQVCPGATLHGLGAALRSRGLNSRERGQDPALCLSALRCRPAHLHRQPLRPDGGATRPGDPCPARDV